MTGVEGAADLGDAEAILQRERPLSRDAKWYSRPFSDIRCPELVAPKQPVVSVPAPLEGGPAAVGMHRYAALWAVEAQRAT